MGEVAKLLGVELNEEFTLNPSNYKYKLTKYGLYKRYKEETIWQSSSMLQDLILGKFTIVKISKSILDYAEKRYLSSIIRPFKDRVIAIAKRTANYGEFIDIMIDEGELGDCGNIYFPFFEPGSMYKGMKVGREYTLEQLEL